MKESIDSGIQLNEEMKKIMDECSDFIKLRGYAEITPDIVAYIIIKKYMDGDGKDQMLLEFLKKVPKGSARSDFRIKFEDILYDESKKVGELSSYVNSDTTPISDKLMELFKLLSTIQKISLPILSKIGFDKPSKGISPTDFLMGLFKYDDLKCVSLLKSYGIYPENIIGHFEDMSGIKDFDLEKLLSGFALGEGIKESAKDKDKDDEKGDEEEDKPNESTSISEEEFEAAGHDAPISAKKIDPNSKTPELDRFAIDITKNAKDGKYDPVLGRDDEISEIIEILCCRKKNNAILLGDPGTGKTAIVELLAMRLAKNNVPMELKGKRIFSLDLNALVAGCVYRGQYEERLQKIIKEVTENREIIIFIDEIHNLLGNGSSSGSGDGANILKPYLARGEFQCIGSTTTDEYRKLIEKDGALKRRFQPVHIEEPNEEQTVAILKGISKEYGNYHGTKYTPETLKKCVEWSGKYITDRFFPDKAIGILDMASASAKLSRPSGMSIEMNELMTEKEKLEEEITSVVKESSGDIDELEKASDLMEKHKEVEDKIKALSTASSKKAESKFTEVTVEDVSKTISKLSGVPIDKILSSDTTKVKEMKDALQKKVIGQDKAVQELTVALQRNILGLRDPKKPIASFLLVGGTGVGKTLISKVLAEEFFGSDKSLVSIACSEYMQDWAESKLLGSAPGYVGFSDSEPRLYILKRKPYVVLLIDEIEKSSTNLYNIWLNMLEEGEITLSNGEKVSCRNTIIIFTGNVGTKSLELKGDGIGFGSVTEEDKRKRDESIVMKEVQKEFRPEFLNRLTKIIIFNSLGKKELGKIFDIEFGKLKARYKETAGYKISVSKEVKELIISKCEPKYGARSLNRLLVEHIDNNVCQALLDEDTDGKTKISIQLEGEEVKVVFS